MKNYLEQQYLKDDLFVDEKFLEINYIPRKILHREQELMILSKIFIRIIEKPFEISRKILIQGPIGVGKTLITKLFGEMILQSAKKRNLNIKYVHVNCRKQKSSYKTLRYILEELGMQIPKRGYSSQELATTLQIYLENNEIYLLLTLDELNYLYKSDFDLIYTLSRLNDSDLGNKSYVSLISIVRDFSLLKNLDSSTISTLQENMLIFKKYSKKQLYDILNQRISKATKTDIFPLNLIEYIANTCSESGDVRKSLNIARNSIKIAEFRGKKTVQLEDVQDSIKNIIPSLQNDIILTLNVHELLLLNSITQLIIEKNKIEVNIHSIKKMYEKLCINYKEEPRKNTQLWHYLNSFKNSNIIDVNIKSKGQRGRTSYYSIKEIPVDVLNDKIKILLKQK